MRLIDSLVEDELFQIVRSLKYRKEAGSHRRQYCIIGDEIFGDRHRKIPGKSPNHDVYSHGCFKLGSRDRNVIVQAIGCLVKEFFRPASAVFIVLRLHPGGVVSGGGQCDAE